MSLKRSYQLEIIPVTNTRSPAILKSKTPNKFCLGEQSCPCEINFEMVSNLEFGWHRKCHPPPSIVTQL